MNIFIEPSDVWLFRDGRPFSPGERGRAESRLFPPTPRTMQGVIRSARLAYSGASFTDQSTWPADVGTPDNFGALQLRGPLVGKRKSNDEVQRFFPLPADVTKLKRTLSDGSESEEWHILAPREDEIKTRWPYGVNLQPLLPPKDKDSEPTKFDEKSWLDENAFIAYLSSTAPNDDTVTKASYLFAPEPRFSVQIDSHPKRPTEGMLYQVEFVRLGKDVGLLVEVEGVTLPPSGLLQLGGEARAGRYEKVETGLCLRRDGRTPQLVGDKVRFKVYLATPALFNKGWLPDAIDAQALQGNWRGISVKLISAAIGKAQSIGGRDISRRDSQRPMRRVVPAGSVYFFETEASADDVMNKFDGQCVSDADADAQIGFGLCYVGRWNP